MTLTQSSEFRSFVDGGGTVFQQKQPNALIINLVSWVGCWNDDLNRRVSHPALTSTSTRWGSILFAAVFGRYTITTGIGLRNRGVIVRSHQNGDTDRSWHDRSWQLTGPPEHAVELLGRDGSVVTN